MYIRKVSIENVKGFKNLTFDFMRPNGSYAGWTVFVGGNSSGKSTLLKAIGLALMGPDTGKQLNGSMQGWITKGEKKASVELEVAWEKAADSFKKMGKLPGKTFNVGVRWSAENEHDIPQFKGVEFRLGNGTRIQTAERGPWDPNAHGWFSAGYGPMRRLTGSTTESVRHAMSGGMISRYVTLFREDAALSESEEWLKKMQSRWLEQRDQNLRTLLDGVQRLLGDGLLPLGMKIHEISVDEVLVKDRNGLVLPMRDISDGCRSMYATVLDLIHGMYEVYGSEGLFSANDQSTFIAKPGVVIIDEVEAHLHPSWQREIPAWLRSRFPFVQFLVSTHSPLIAQSADENGVFALPLQDEPLRIPRALSTNEIERIRLGRAEKTLLGVAFGLRSSRSTWATQQIEYWKRLNAKVHSDVPLTTAERNALEVLKPQMKLVFELPDDTATR